MSNNENQHANNSNNDPKWTSGASPSNEEKGTANRSRTQSMKKSFFLDRLTHSDPVAIDTNTSQGSNTSQNTTESSASPKTSDAKKTSPSNSQSSPSTSKSSKEGTKSKTTTKSASFIQEKPPTPQRNIIYQGALTKMGKVRQNWLLRWFVLDWTEGDKPKLSYYPSNIDSTPLGQIVLDKSSQIMEDSSKNKPFCFRIEREHARTFYLCASSDEDKNKWMATLTQTVRQLRKHSEFFSLVGIYNTGVAEAPAQPSGSPRVSQMVPESQLPYVRTSKQLAMSKSTAYEPPAPAPEEALSHEERKKLLTRHVSVPLDMGSQLMQAPTSPSRKNWKSGIPEEKNVVLIYGLNFVVGSELIKLLTDPMSAWHARLAVRDDVRFPPMSAQQVKLLESRGAEVVTISFDLSNRGSMEAEEASEITSSQNANIFVGVKKMLIFCELGQTSDLLPEMHQLISEAKKFKVKHVIKCSYMGCEKWHRFAENRILKCGLNSTIVHHNALMQSFLVDGVKQTGTFSLPLKPTTLVSWLHARDLALALLQVLMGAEEHYSKVYTLTGSQAIHCQAIELYVSKAAKKNVKYTQVSEEETLKQLTEVAELPEWLASSYTEYFRILVMASDQTQEPSATPQNINTAQVSADINGLIGRKPITFEEFSEEESSIKVFREPYLFYFDEQSEELKSLYNQFDRMRTLGTVRPKNQPFSGNAGNQTLIHDVVVDKSAFVRCMNLILGTDQVGEPLWRAFVKANPNKLTFKEYAAGVGKLAKGKPDEVLDFGFRMYEENELINESQFLDICKALHRLATNKPLDEKKTEFLQNAFRAVAKERTRVTLDDFINGFKRDKLFLENLGVPYLSNPSAVRLKTNFRKQSITFGHENWDLAEAVTIGIYTSMQDKKPANVTPTEVTMEQRSPVDYCVTVSSSQTPSINLCPEDFDSTQHVIIERESAVPFTDYAPNAFRKIRESCGISDEEYMASFSPENLFGTLEEVISTGRSGSFFFRTKDKKYLLKTLPPEEAQLLMKSLFDYTMYIIKNPHTLLVRFFGHHKLVYQKRDIYFVVMANVFHTNLPIHEQYDLKGSTLGRHVDVDTSGVSDLSEIALKDLNFDRKLYLDAVLRTRLLEQLESDTKFMEERNVCDYSLLVGIHYMDRDTQNTKIVKKPAVSMFQYDDGGLQARTDEQGLLKEVYFLGIVDILTLYDLKKKSEHAIKQILYLTPDTAISAIPPTPYRERFMRYVASIVETAM